MAVLSNFAIIIPDSSVPFLDLPSLKACCKELMLVFFGHHDIFVNTGMISE
jgi:hypothetical protein